MTLDQTCKKVNKVFKSIPQKPVSVEGELLSIHQAVDFLWAMYRENKGQEEIRQKTVNVFISVFLAAIKLDLKNLDKDIDKRINEIKTAPYKGTLPEKFWPKAYKTMLAKKKSIKKP